MRARPRLIGQFLSAGPAAALREQARITAEVADAESQLANDGEKLAAKQIIDLALDPAKDCAANY
jgi:hypothetical protein